MMSSLDTQSGIIPLEIARFANSSVVFVIIVVIILILIAGIIVTVAAIIIRIGIITQRRSGHG